MAEKQSGYTIIPASQRPDGTWRKEIKVKAGYIPPDEVEKYKSFGCQSTPNTGLPPGMTVDGDAATKKTKNQKKNERKKLKKQEMKSKEGDVENEHDELVGGVGSLEIKEGVSENNQTMSKEAISKKLKNLRKKLKQIEELERKVTNKEIKELSKEQSDKIARKKAVLDEIEDVELDLKLLDN